MNVKKPSELEHAEPAVAVPRGHERGGCGAAPEEQPRINVCADDWPSAPARTVDVEACTMHGLTGVLLTFEGRGFFMPREGARALAGALLQVAEYLDRKLAS
jgi:hypothetical protein